MKYFKNLVLATTLIIAFFAFGNSNVYAKEKAVSFQKKQITVYTKDTVKVKAKIGLEKYKNKKIVYSVSNKKVAKVNKKGVVTGKKKGTVTVYAQIKGTTKKAKCKVKVLQGINKINITSNTTVYYVGNKYQLTATVRPLKIDERLKWKSSNKEVVNVNQKGVIKVKKEGKVTIEAYGAKTKIKSEIVINAKEFPRMDFAEGKKLVVSTGQSSQLHVRFVNKPWKQYTYKAVDSSIVKVTPQGLITAVRPGQAYIKATTIDNTETATILVIVEEKQGYITKSMLDNMDIDDRTNLMIVAHPDDETLWGGAHLKEGKWFIVCMTNQYTRSRKDEYKKVLKAAGAKGIILDYPDVIFNEDGHWDKDNWTYVDEGAYKDALEVIKYKNWNLIATHSPAGETGHRQHKKTNQAVTKACKTLGVFDKLWYFGKFFDKGKIPADFPKITDEELAFKQSLLDLYVGEQNSIHSFWEQMNPYENWVKATAYK